MESLLGPKRVTFEVLRARLIQQVKLRINNGEFTERGLSRILGISQSQTHNVLKGARSLQVRLADQILVKLGMSATDLLNQDELDTALRLKLQEWDQPFNTEERSTVPKKPAGRIYNQTDMDDEQTG